VTPKKKRVRAKKVPGKSGAKSGLPMPLAAADGAPLVPQPHGGALKAGGDHARPGRPRDETRALVRQLLRDKVLPRAVEVIGASTDGDLHLRAIEKLTEVGFNEKIRVAQTQAAGRAAAAAASKSGSSASVEVHVSGGPTGVERATGTDG
jgi:hypothetical protein